MKSSGPAPMGWYFHTGKQVLVYFDFESPGTLACVIPLHILKKDWEVSEFGLANALPRCPEPRGASWQR
jgi:hypothetical protein